MWAGEVGGVAARGTGTLVSDREDTRLSTVISLLAELQCWGGGRSGDGVIILHVIIRVIRVIRGCLVHGDALHILMVPAPHVPPGVDHLDLATVGNVGVDHAMTTLDLGTPATDGEPLWIISLLADDLWQYSSPGIDEPVADLEDCQPRLLGQGQLLSVAGVGIVAVVIQPASQHQDGLLGQVASSLPGRHHGS